MQAMLVVMWTKLIWNRTKYVRARVKSDNYFRFWKEGRYSEKKMHTGPKSAGMALNRCKKLNFRRLDNQNGRSHICRKVILTPSAHHTRIDRNAYFSRLWPKRRPILQLAVLISKTLSYFWPLYKGQRSQPGEIHMIYVGHVSGHVC